MSRNKKYKMMPISSNFTEKSGYRAQFVGDGYSIDARKEILPAVIRSTGVQIGEGTAWDLIETFLKECAARSANSGETVTVGSLLTFALSIHGWFANKDSKADKDNVRVSARLLNDLKPTVAFSMSNDIEGATLTLYTIMSDGCQLGHVRQGAAFRINGKHLMLVEGDRVTASAKNGAGETVEAECAVIESADDHIDATLAAAFNAQEFVDREIVFKVEGRCGDPTAGTQTKAIAATLDYSDTPNGVGITGVSGMGLENGRLDLSGATSITGWGFSGENMRVNLKYTNDEGANVDENVPANMLESATDNEIVISPNAWPTLGAPFGDVTFTVTTDKGSASATARVGE